MSLFDKFLPIVKIRSELQELGVMPFGAVTEKILSATEAIVNGHKVILAGTNNYLGLTFDPECIAAAKRAVEEQGTGTTGSRMANGTFTEHVKLEQELAAYFDRKHSIVFSTGYAATMGMGSTLAGPGDVIVLDADSHASIYDGVRLGGADIIRFRHNDAADLAKRLRRLGERVENTLIIVEGIYSMLGDQAPLADIAAVKRKYGGTLLVDEAHSLGMLGEHGRGVAEAAGVDVDEVGVPVVPDAPAAQLQGGVAENGALHVGQAHVDGPAVHVEAALRHPPARAPQLRVGLRRAVAGDHLEGLPGPGGEPEVVEHVEQRRVDDALLAAAVVAEVVVPDKLDEESERLLRELAAHRGDEVTDDVADHAHKLPSAVSGGQQQRVALIRAMAPRPEILLLDEPFSGLDVELREQLAREVRDILVRMLPARVVEKTLLAKNVVRLRLRLPSTQRLQFLAGQYVDMLLQDGKRRAFSIASCPSLESEIELHIRHVEGGDFTGHVFDDLQVRDILRFEGPLGNFFVRNDRPERPIIMMGGGTGFAPLKSMIENLLQQDDRRPIHLYWGTRTAEELYLDALPGQWAREHDHIVYRRALSEAGTDDGLTAFRGLVHEAVLADHPDLSEFDAYMSGPPAMIDIAKKTFVKHGLPEDRMFYDSFEFGLDVPVRVLARPH